MSFETFELSNVVPGVDPKEKEKYLTWLSSLTSGHFVKVVIFDASKSNEFLILNSALIENVTDTFLTVVYHIDDTAKKKRVLISKGYTGLTQIAPLKLFLLMPIGVPVDTDLMQKFGLSYRVLN